MQDDRHKGTYLMKNILVTGAAGFIGFHLANKLLKNGENVIGIDNLNSYYDVDLKQARLSQLEKYDNFRFVRSGIENREMVEYVFKEGKLSTAIRASCSIPAIFSPIKHDGKVLIDGGAVNPLPFDLLKDFCDITIAIDVTSFQPGTIPELPSTFDSVFTTYQIMQHSIIKEKLKFAKPDIYIKPKISDVRVFDFAKADSIFEQAKPAKKELKKQLEKFLTTK